MFNETLRRLRKAKGFTQKKLAEELSISTSAIGMYESGQREPDSAMLRKLSKYFDVSIDYLIGENYSDDHHASSDLNEVLDDFRSYLDSRDSLMFNGVPLEKDDIQKIMDAIEVGAALAISKKKRNDN